MAIDHQLPIVCQFGQHLGFEADVGTSGHQIEHPPLEQHEAAVDPVGQARPFYKPIDQAFLIGFDDTLLQVNLHCRDGGQFAVCAMKFYQRLQIDVADIITVSYEES